MSRVLTFGETDWIRRRFRRQDVFVTRYPWWSYIFPDEGLSFLIYGVYPVLSSQVSGFDYFRYYVGLCVRLVLGLVFRFSSPEKRSRRQWTF